jgi:hypothetical protein
LCFALPARKEHLRRPVLGWDGAIMTAIESTAEAATAAASAEKPASGEPPHVERPLRGVLLVSLAVLFFACNDITTKYLVGHYEVPMVAAVRYIIHLLLMVALLGPSLGRRLVIVHRPALVLVRAACLVASTLFMGLGFQLMPVAESVSIVYLAGRGAAGPPAAG